MSSDIVIDSGRSLTVDFGPVTRLDAQGNVVAVDLSADGTKLWFSVKRAPTDDVPVTQKTYSRAAGQTTSDGFTVTTASTTVSFNGSVHVPAGELLSDEAALWAWDLTLQEPSGDTETLQRGALKVRPAVTDAA